MKILNQTNSEKLLCKTNSETATKQRRFGLPQKIIVELDIDYLITGNWHKDKNLHSNGLCVGRAVIRQDGEIQCKYLTGIQSRCP